jgi:hypothetical protein
VYANTGNYTPLSGSGPHKYVQNLTLQTGPLGHFYLPSSATTLIDGGSRDADDGIGLYHFTTQPGTGISEKEGSSTVDIGFHYVAVNAGLRPWDSDKDGSPSVDLADGLPDYLEDKNGNGLHDTGVETDWTKYKTDNARSDYQVFLENSMNPKPFVVTWRMAYNAVNHPHDTLVQGSSSASEYDDYRIIANLGEGLNRSVYVQMEHKYRGKPLSNWKNGDSEKETRFFLPPAPNEGEYHQFGIVYDLQTLLVYVNGHLVLKSLSEKGA